MRPWSAADVFCAKAKRQQQQKRLIGRPQQSAQSEWKSTPRYGDGLSLFDIALSINNLSFQRMNGIVR
ncbi:hypothetical protein FJQ98_19765 [Lysinibacillus agricola]|uniref:Uncharacterized protein n=1 Tax=Lysinibacillus agricola TaxID=2590012 RepID=A0ABX7ANS8_9BACI|nr:MULTISPECIES: hypothetical protein [Lysinibacillus]KOS61023.1 hypothetical protein AN161_20880 [Lysinibacillus sp. FJAT-14222]QQP11421.1 hypothetical protein FJQ98_19765 [Lysinibacillus agricola]